MKDSRSSTSPLKIRVCCQQSRGSGDTRLSVVCSTKVGNKLRQGRGCVVQNCEVGLRLSGAGQFGSNTQFQVDKMTRCNNSRRQELGREESIAGCGYWADTYGTSADGVMVDVEEKSIVLMPNEVFYA